MKKADFIALVASKSGLKKTEIERALEGITVVIRHNVMEMNDPIVLGDLGTFKRQDSKARIGRNPSDGSQVNIPARSKLVFKARKSA